jgi:hypothetical protein
MSRKVSVLYVDDLSGTEIPEGEGGAVSFALDGHEYEIDLSNENADKMRDVLGRYVKAARRVTRSSSSSRRSSSGASGRSDADRHRTQEIRAWAENAGLMPKGRKGRIPGAIIEQWESRKHGTQTAMPDPLAEAGRAVAARYVDDKGKPVDPEATPEQTAKAVEVTGGAGFDAPKKAQGESTTAPKPAAPKKDTAKVG